MSEMKRGASCQPRIAAQLGTRYSQCSSIIYMPVRKRPPSSRVVCPACRSVKVVPTIKSARGSYYRCNKCGHVWHRDEEPKVPPA